jgi:hypothetical protein
MRTDRTARGIGNEQFKMELILRIIKEQKRKNKRSIKATRKTVRQWKIFWA